MRWPRVKKVRLNATAKKTATRPLMTRRAVRMRGFRQTDQIRVRSPPVPPVGPGPYSRQLGPEPFSFGLSGQSGLVRDQSGLGPRGEALAGRRVHEPELPAVRDEVQAELPTPQSAVLQSHRAVGATRQSVTLEARIEIV